MKSGDHEFGGQFILQNSDGIFETGAYRVPSKSQNPTVLGQGGPYSTQCSNLAGHTVGTIRWHHPLAPSVGTIRWHQQLPSILTQY